MESTPNPHNQLLTLLSTPILPGTSSLGCNRTYYTYYIKLLCSSTNGLPGTQVGLCPSLWDASSWHAPALDLGKHVHVQEKWNRSAAQWEGMSVVSIPICKADICDLESLPLSLKAWLYPHCSTMSCRTIGKCCTLYNYWWVMYIDYWWLLVSGIHCTTVGEWYSFVWLLLSGVYCMTLDE